mmetsp:Transcript_37173/g.85898  ORF Transcript_37173/g.85898 Transcript_37173/m.85898 type:complete len:232 (-) Transcript_37173:29-724(-)
MLANDVPVHILRVQIHGLGNQGLETRGIQASASPENLPLREVRPCQLGGNGSHDVAWVAHNQNGGIWRILDHLRHDLLQDVGIAVHQTESGLARLLGNTCSNDNHIGIFTHIISVRSHDGGVLMESTTLLEVFGFALQLLGGDINHGDGATNVLVEDGSHTAQAHLPHPDDRHLLAAVLPKRSLLGRFLGQGAVIRNSVDRASNAIIHEVVAELSVSLDKVWHLGRVLGRL